MCKMEYVILSFLHCCFRLLQLCADAVRSSVGSKGVGGRSTGLVTKKGEPKAEPDARSSNWSGLAHPPDDFPRGTCHPSVPMSRALGPLPGSLLTVN